MVRKSEVLNIRVTEQQRAAYERAAMLAHTTVSSLVTGAADEAAANVLATHASMTLPDDVFDALVAALDQGTSLAKPLVEAFEQPAYKNR